MVLVASALSEAQDFTYTNNNGTITITGYKGSSDVIIIPSTINGLPVTSIGADAFIWQRFTSVTIPDSITNIEYEAFGECKLLTSVTIPNSVTTIGARTFAGCDSLTNVTVPNSITSIEQSAFNLCISLNGLTIPNSVTNIGGAAFGWCTSLTSVTFPNSVTTIGGSAFEYSGLTNVAIPNSVTTIGARAFKTYTLTNMMVEAENVNYSSLNGVLFDKTQTTLVEYPIGRVATSFTFPDTVTHIGEAAFEGCTNLAFITTLSHMTSIGNNAFFECTNLTSVTLSGSVTIGDFAFGDCYSMREIYIQGNSPPSVTFWSFQPNNNATVYYLPGTLFWSDLDGLQAKLWNPQVQTMDANFGIRTNRFGFNVSGTPNIPMVIEATSNLAAQSWVGLQNCTLTNGLIYFSDPQWTNYPSRFYRIRSP